MFVLEGKQIRKYRIKERKRTHNPLATDELIGYLQIMYKRATFLISL